MNKGIKQAKGEYCLFLNSGDWLSDENVVGDFCESKFEEDIISGNIVYLENNNSSLWESLPEGNISFEYFYANSLPHPASFIKRKLFYLYGLYSEEYKIISDWEFFLKCLIINNCSYKHFNRVISFFERNGISSQHKSISLVENERELVFQAHLPLIYKSYKKVCEERDNYENLFREYMNLKNGKFSFFIRLFLSLKRKKKEFGFHKGKNP